MPLGLRSDRMTAEIDKNQTEQRKGKKMAKSYADQRSIWRVDLFREAIKDEKVMSMASEIKKFLIERQSLTERIGQHNDAIDRLVRMICQCKNNEKKKVLAETLEQLRTSRTQLSKLRSGYQLPKEMLSCVRIAIELTQEKQRGQTWYEYIEERLDDLQRPLDLRIKSHVSDMIARVIDDLESSSVDSINRQNYRLLAALAALATMP